MGAFETLKEELQLQKQAIESKGGTVSVVNDYPSPSEITAGIYTTTGKDLSDATATETDVLAGKTFYAGNEILKTGTLEIVDHMKLIKELFLSGENYATDGYVLTFPAGIKVTARNMFRNNTKKATIYLNEELTTISEYSFCETTNFTFPNFNSLQNLNEIGQYAFYGNENGGIDFTNLPRVSTISSYAFYNCLTSGDLVIPSSLKSLNNYAFARTKVAYLDNLIFEDGFSLTSLPSNLCAYLNFSCDFVVPPTVTRLSSYCFYNASFNTLTIPATVKNIEYEAIGITSSSSASNFNMKSITFESSTVPTISSHIIGAQHISNGLKIYVPDESLEAYKSYTNLVKYADCIYPVSQKE